MENDGAEDHLVVLDSSSGLFNIIRHFEIYIGPLPPVSEKK